MIVSTPIYHQALVEIEATTPHGVHAGHGDMTHDVLLVRDANGLPYLPATGLAGVLRHLCLQQFGTDIEQDLFGYARGNDGQTSRIQLTAGVVHDSVNRPCEGLVDLASSDALLALLMEDKPLVRQRVKLNNQGAAVDNGKFDVTCIPAGVRYSFFIGYWSDSEQQGYFEQLLQLVGSVGFRLGHGTRSGHGAFKVNRLDYARWDLTTKAGRNGYQQRTRSRAERHGLVPYTLDKTQNCLQVDIKLKAEAGWRIGGGEQAFSEPDTNGRLPDLLPQSEVCVNWTQTKAHLEIKKAVVPASAVKGALAHRFAYHYRCLTGQFLTHTDQLSEVETNNLQLEGVQELFGFASDGDVATGAAGKLLLDDIYLDSPVTARQTHNKIDHFTGGVINGALFEEEYFWQTPLVLSLRILQADSLSSQSREALKRTLDDLCEGFLPLGAGSSRGLGVFVATDSLVWSDQGQWIQQADSTEIA